MRSEVLTWNWIPVGFLDRTRHRSFVLIFIVVLARGILRGKAKQRRWDLGGSIFLLLLICDFDWGWNVKRRRTQVSRSVSRWSSWTFRP